MSWRRVISDIKHEAKIRTENILNSLKNDPYEFIGEVILKITLKKKPRKS
jgi:hypothetical protein